MKAPQNLEKEFKPFERPARPDTILKRAKRVIEDGEWAKGAEIKTDLDEGELSFCLLGAIRLANGEPMSYRNDTHRFLWSDGEYWAKPFHFDELEEDDPARIAIEALVESISSQARVKQRLKRNKLTVIDAVTGYNDDDHRRRGDILKLLDRAIDWLKSR